jgi:hypothetical protein
VAVADGARSACGGECCGGLGTRKRGGLCCSPHDRGSAKERATRMERQRRLTSAGAVGVLRWRFSSAREEGDPGHEIIKQETRAESEDEGSLRDVHLCWEASMAGNGARRGSLATVCTGARSAGSRGCERRNTEALGELYRARRGRGASARVMAINGHGGRIDCVQGEGLNG